MIYALRKLIAFVFLGGMFWFIYQDLDNLGKPWFMHALGFIAVAFVFFWLLIPMVVVQCRIAARRRQNRERHDKWLADGGLENVRERRSRKSRLDLEPGEQACFHEKGTLYICCDSPEARSMAGTGRPVGRPSDVAFPGWRRKCIVVQRTHCYFTNRRVIFAGRDLLESVSFAELKSFSDTPGGLVFELAAQGAGSRRLAFTFQNPLIAADILRFALKEVS